MRTYLHNIWFLLFFNLHHKNVVGCPIYYSNGFETCRTRPNSQLHESKKNNAFTLMTTIFFIFHSFIILITLKMNFEWVLCAWCGFIQRIQLLLFRFLFDVKSKYAKSRSNNKKKIPLHTER